MYNVKFPKVRRPVFLLLQLKSHSIIQHIRLSLKIKVKIVIDKRYKETK